MFVLPPFRAFPQSGLEFVTRNSSVATIHTISPTHDDSSIVVREATTEAKTNLLPEPSVFTYFEKLVTKRCKSYHASLKPYPLRFIFTILPTLLHIQITQKLPNPFQDSTSHPQSQIRASSSRIQFALRTTIPLSSCAKYG